MRKNSKIYVAGHRGLVGAAIVRELEVQGYTNIICRTSKELDLRIQDKVEKFFEKEKPEIVILSAAKVGGIKANMSFPAEFLHDNLMIQSNVIHAAYKNSVKKLLFLGTSCIYPKHCEQPMREEYLLGGYPEPTNEAYAIAKIAGLKMCEYYYKQYGYEFISCMPTNIYGPFDNFNPESSHVIPALIQKLHDAKINDIKEVEIWGTGNARREFLYVNDLAKACVFLLENYNKVEFVNIGTGIDISIKELVDLIKGIVGYKGEISFDTSKPDGNMRKLLDVTKVNKLGWKAETELKQGLVETYKWFLENKHKER